MIEYITPVTTVTGNATQTGTDVSAWATQWTLCLEVLSMSPDISAQIVFQDSTDGFATDILAGPTATISGGITTKGVFRLSWKFQDWPDLRIGVTAAKLRTVVQRFAGSGSLTIRSWIE